MFKKGVPRHELAGRKKGSTNKLSTAVKEATVYAAELAGEDLKNKLPGIPESGSPKFKFGPGDGVVRYLKWLALYRPELFAPLFAKLYPTQLTGKDDGPIEIVQYESVEEAIEACRESGLPEEIVFPPMKLVSSK